ncbi:hypothetical protein CMI42_01350 [Candidatus Pacearchaeota archaeon]|nr:hypothetical protein [Candidatus Pacearchaeota archaeon]|tara:strand:+ start:284 stop:574 length:291 start_codon:yes stop_codon:yes gene_type:complete
MGIIFEVIDKINRKIHLSMERWSHIRQHHPNVEYSEEVRETLLHPDKIIMDEREGVENCFKYFKHKNQKSRFLKVVVRFLNTNGFVLSAHFVRDIR